MLCVNHEIGNVSLDTRCRGLADGLAKAGSAMQVGLPSVLNCEAMPARIAASCNSMTLAGGPQNSTTSGSTGVSPSGAYTTTPGVVGSRGIWGTSSMRMYPKFAMNPSVSSSSAARCTSTTAT